MPIILVDVEGRRAYESDDEEKLTALSKVESALLLVFKEALLGRVWGHFVARTYDTCTYGLATSSKGYMYMCLYVRATI